MHWHSMMDYGRTTDGKKSYSLFDLLAWLHSQHAIGWSHQDQRMFPHGPIS